MAQTKRAVNRERWAKELEAWRASGTALSAWARRRGLSRDALEYWKRRIAAPKRLPARADRPLTLIPLPAPTPVAAAAPIELTVGPSGCRLLLPADFDGASLVRLLDVLETRC